MKQCRVAFNNKTFWRNTLQTFIFGYLSMIGIALWITNGAEPSGIDFIHPVLWLLPIITAPIIGVARALNIQ